MIHPGKQSTSTATTSADATWQNYLRSAHTMCDFADKDDPFTRFAASWADRAAVKGKEPHLAEVFQPQVPDFLVDLLPFRDHPLFESAPPEWRQRVLSCGWLAYNAKTIAIESRIISPACTLVVEDEVPGIPGSRYREASAQAMVDEAYHVLLTSNACDITREQRGLQHVRIPQFDLVTNMQQLQDEHSARWQKIVIQLATAVVSELLVSDYLRLLSDSPTVQPLNVLTTAIHRKDESAHNGLFKVLGTSIFHALNQQEREFFVESLIKPHSWFASSEFAVWRSMLRQIEFPRADAMIDECEALANEADCPINLASLEGLLLELDLDPNLLNAVCIPQG